jgi:hypothetical protein
VTGLRRVCDDAVKDFHSIPPKQWYSERQKADRRAELNQAIWKANNFMVANGVEPVKTILAERIWADGEKVKTPYGSGIIKGFDPEFNQYEVALDWRPLDVQVNEHLQKVKEDAIRPRAQNLERRTSAPAPLETVVETDEASDDEGELKKSPLRRAQTASAKAFTNPTTTTTGTEGSTKELTPTSSSAKEAKKLASHLEVKGPTSAMSDSSSISSISSDDSHEKSAIKTGPVHVTAKIDGRFISKFVPPHLPVFEKKPSSLVSFWTGSPTPKPVKKPTYQEGEKCSTPYGPAIVVEHRVAQNMVVVDMIGWKARAYLNDDCIKIEKESLLASLFRRQAGTPTQAEPPKQLDFPFAQGTVIRTPYGEAEVIRPLPVKYKKEGSKVDPEGLNQVICLGITAWRLADGSHPKLYCTVKNAQQWKESKTTKAPDGILSAFGTLVSSTLDFAGRFSSSQKPKEESEPAPIKFVQYYRESAAVSTAFGTGRVVGFREKDGFYKISLTSWTLANKKHPVAWIRGVDIKYAIAKDCEEGYPVLTNLGLTGILESVQPTTGESNSKGTTL